MRILDFIISKQNIECDPRCDLLRVRKVISSLDSDFLPIGKAVRRLRCFLAGVTIFRPQSLTGCVSFPKLL